MPKAVTRIKEKEFKNLKNDLERLRDDLSQLLSSVSEASKEEIGEVREKAQGELQNLLSQVDQTYQQIREQSKVMRERVEKNVEERPLTSLLVAFGAGAAIGSIVSKIRR